MASYCDVKGKGKKICGAPMDGISMLPDDVMSKILEYLPLRDAAQLSLVSRKWRYTWMSLPQLMFDAEFFTNGFKYIQQFTYKFHNIVSLILLSHVGPISKIYLYIPTGTTSIPEIGPWISFLSRNNVKDITLENAHQTALRLPSHLFSCLELEKLKLRYCIFDPLPSFRGFKNLRSLELENIMFAGNKFEDFIASCPLLECLTLKKWTGFAFRNITAPNLKYLTMSGSFVSIFSLSAHNLIAISITLETKAKNHCKDQTQNLIRFLANSSKIEKLYFGGYFFKFLSAGGISGLLPTAFKCVKALWLSKVNPNDLDEFLSAVGMIQSCPYLEELQLSLNASSCELNHEYYPPYVMGHLRKVHIATVMGTRMELKLIEVLLLCSPVLEKLYVERSTYIFASQESRMSKELMRFRRASPWAQVVYLDPKPGVFRDNVRAEWFAS